MKKQMTFQQYRSIDLFFFFIILAVSEWLIYTAATSWFPAQAYTVSVVSAVTAIVLMRWNGWAAIHAVAGGLLYCLFSHATGGQVIIYCTGNLGALLSLVLIRLLGKKRICEDSFLTVLFALLTTFFMQAGRAAAAMVLGTSPRDCLVFFTTDALSGLFAMVILWIARRLDGLFEDQKHYLLRINGEEEKEDAE